MGQTRLDWIIASKCCLGSSMLGFRGAVWTKTGVFAEIFNANESPSAGSCFEAHAGMHLLECLYNLTPPPPTPPALPAEHFRVCHSDINVTQTTVDVSDSPLESPIFFLSV